MIRRIIRSVTNSGAATPKTNEVTKVNLFEPIPPECDHDCESCTATYPASFEIEEKEALWNSAKGWASHVIVATGETDWVRNVTSVLDCWNQLCCLQRIAN